MLSGRRILLIVSGSVAAYKALEFTRLARKAGATVTAILTAGGARFVTKEALAAITGQAVHDDLWAAEAEIGHIRVVPEGHLCGCGARGCFEQYGSGNALMRHAREAIAASPDIARNLLSRGDGTLEGLTGKAITDAARDGDAVALAAFNTTGQWLGAGIATLSVILDPECVVIGGGVIDAGEILLQPTREALHRYMPFAGKHPYPEIIAAQLGNEAGLVGVADLARL